MDHKQKKTGANCVRAIILGNSQVGKTSLINRYTDGVFDESFAPTLGDSNINHRG